MTRGERRQHEKGPRENAGAKEKKPYILCDLCNNILEFSDHKTCQHNEVEYLLSTFSSNRANTNSDFAKQDESLGNFVLRCVKDSDGGKETFDVMCNCLKQLNRLLSESMDERPKVFLFGSCVTMGIWDGFGDGDFTVVIPEMIAENEEIRKEYLEKREKQEKNNHESAESKQKNDLRYELPIKEEKELISGVAKKMRNSGFQFEELEVILHTRIPVVRRKRLSDTRYESRFANQPYMLEFVFDKKSALDLYKNKFFPKFCSPTYGAQLDEAKSKKLTQVFSLKDGASALRLFSRNEEFGVRKQWMLNGRLPEIFFVDFDISSRIYGVRNSWFLRKYMEQSELFRVGNLFVKKWSKARGVNNSRQGYLTSYAMSVMWIYYLLRTGKAKFVEPSSVGPYPSLDQLTVSYVPLWPPLPDDSKRAEAEKDRIHRLGTLIRGFFAFYANEFDWENEVVCLRYDVAKEGPLTKAKVNWTAENEIDSVLLRERVFYNICIDDVYEENLNLARHLSKHKADWLKSQFSFTLTKCTTVDDTIEEIITDVHAFCKASVQNDINQIVLKHPNCAMKVGELRQELLRVNPYTPVYVLQHRISDLWQQPNQLKDDIRLVEQYGRKVEIGESTSWCTGWNLVSPSVESDKDCDTFNDFDVFFCHNYKGDLTVPQSDARLEQLAVEREHWEQLWAQASQSVECGVSLTREEDLLPNSFARLCLFCVDHRAFNTYLAKERFLRHLTALSKFAVEEAKEFKKNKYKYLSVKLPNGEAVSKKIMESIIEDKKYFTGGNTATESLKSHSATRETEETVHRSKEKKVADQRPSFKRIVRDSTRPKGGGKCDECHQPAITFPSSNPKADPGCYCAKCWDYYEKGSQSYSSASHFDQNEILKALGHR